MSNTDTPGTFKKRRLKKGVVPSVNLRGKEIDESTSKRSLPRERAGTPRNFDSSSNDSSPGRNICIAQAHSNTATFYHCGGSREK